MTASNPYRVDPDDPRAPSLEVWRELSSAERARIVAELPSEVDLGPPEGDAHRVPKQRALEALEAFFKRAGRKVYFSSELPVYYPGERMFAPDLIAVLDVEPHERASWVVAEGGRGVDFALEITLSGSRRKDLEENVVRFAALGIPEYFVFDRPKRRILGYRLSQAGSAYDPILLEEGRWGSNVLGLELGIEESRFRFYVGSAVVPEASELVERANQLSERLQDKLAEVEALLQQADERAELEQRQRELAERRVQELEAELERLRRERRDT